MVQILPRFDPGYEIGKSFGSGVGGMLGQQADRSRMLKALDNLSTLEEDVTYMEGGKELTRPKTFSEKLQTLVKSGAGIPGWMGVVETLAPTLLRESKGKAGGRIFAGDKAQEMPEGAQATKEQPVMGESAPAGYKREGKPLNVEQRINQYLQEEQDYASNAQHIPEELTSEIPRFDETPPAYKVPTEQEVRRAIDEQVQAGGTPEEAFNILERKRALRQQQYQSQLDNFQRRLGLFKEERGLEETQRDFVDRQSKSFLNQKGIGTQTEQGYKIPQYYTDIAYDMFRREAAKNKKGTDQQNWSAARKKLDQLLELEASASDLTRPLLPGLKGSENTIKQTEAWTRDYLELAGNTPEARDKAKSMLMDNGWSRNRATEFVQPMSQGLSGVFRKIPKMIRSAATTGSANVQAQIEKKREDIMGQIQSLVPDIANNFGDVNSILLFRNKLINDKNLSQTQADEIIEQVRKYRGGLMPEQSKEIPLLQNTPIRDMWDIFHDSWWRE